MRVLTIKFKIMRNLFLVLLVIVTSLVNAQQRKVSLATVDKVEGIPMFLFSEPVEEYEIVGKAVTGGHILKLTLDETSTIDDKAKQLVEKALKRKEDGKVPEFDAIIVDVFKEKAKAIKFKNGVSLKAKVEKENGVPVYFYSKPVKDYEIVALLPRDYSLYAANNLLYDKIKSSVNRILKKEEAGEVGHFDAVIFNPEDLSTTLVKFK